MDFAALKNIGSYGKMETIQKLTVQNLQIMAGMKTTAKMRNYGSARSPQHPAPTTDVQVLHQPSQLQSPWQMTKLHPHLGQFLLLVFRQGALSNCSVIFYQVPHPLGVWSTAAFPQIYPDPSWLSGYCSGLCLQFNTMTKCGISSGNMWLSLKCCLPCWD